MKEKIYTIPVNDGFDEKGECPFCAMERAAERGAIRYVAGPGASYMEPDVRAATDKAGFCRQHMKKLYDYGNTLGNALMLQTYYLCMLDRLKAEMAQFEAPAPKKLFAKPQVSEDGLWKQVQQETDNCCICDRLNDNMMRYYHTFFVLLKDAEFRSRVENCKGFCLHHFSELLHAAEEYLPNGQRQWFYDTVFPLMENNLVRVKNDLDWLVAKFDYRNASADWKNSRDALQRAMQKLGAGHVADKPFKAD